MDVREVGWEGVEGMHLAQDREKWQTVVNTVMNLVVSKKTDDFFISCLTVSFSRKTLLHEVSK